MAQPRPAGYRRFDPRNGTLCAQDRRGRHKGARSRIGLPAFLNDPRHDLLVSERLIVTGLPQNKECQQPRECRLPRRAPSCAPALVVGSYIRGLGDVMRSGLIIALAALCSGCAANEVATFQAGRGQESIVRDGQAALVSRDPSSLVIIKPASRQFQSGGRPTFVVGIYNLSSAPLQFRVADVTATQSVNQQLVQLKVFTYDELAQEEKNRQIAAAILTGLAVGANAASAATAGHYNSTSTVYTPSGTYQVQTTGYSPTANAIAQANASAENEALISATIERGQQNLATLERTVIKDDTIFPGEWYGGLLVLQPLTSDDSRVGPKMYSIALLVGRDRHEIDITQSPVR